MKNLTVPERLIVAADYQPEGSWKAAYRKVLSLAEALRDLDVYIKVNSVLRAAGYRLIWDLHELGLKVFADLKLIDIPATLEMDGQLLKEFGPEIVTVMCQEDNHGMAAFKQAVSTSTEVLGVTELTSAGPKEQSHEFSQRLHAKVLQVAFKAQSAGLDGIVLPPTVVGHIAARSDLQLSLNSPSIRPTSLGVVDDDDQRLVMTPTEAIRNGAHRVIIGRPITRHPNPRFATELVLQEIAEAVGHN